MQCAYTYDADNHFSRIDTQCYNGFSMRDYMGNKHRNVRHCRNSFVVSIPEPLLRVLPNFPRRYATVQDVPAAFRPLAMVEDSQSVHPFTVFSGAVRYHCALLHIL